MLKPGTIEELEPYETLWQNAEARISVFTWPQGATVSDVRIVTLELLGQKTRWFEVEGLGVVPAGQAVIRKDTLLVYETAHWIGPIWVGVKFSKGSWFERNISPGVVAENYKVVVPANVNTLVANLPEGIYQYRDGRLWRVRDLGTVDDFYNVPGDGDYYITAPGLGLRFKIAVVDLIARARSLANAQPR